jgi:hypothetical protein
MSTGAIIAMLTPLKIAPKHAKRRLKDTQPECFLIDSMMRELLPMNIEPIPVSKLVTGYYSRSNSLLALAGGCLLLEHLELS